MASYVKKNKYNANRSYGFDSDAEKEYDGILRLLKLGGHIKGHIHHPPAVLLAGVLKWRVDFLVTDNDGQEFYVEVKGMATQDYKNKLIIFKKEKPAPLFVVTKYGPNRFKVIDEVATEKLTLNKFVIEGA